MVTQTHVYLDVIKVKRKRKILSCSPFYFLLLAWCRLLIFVFAKWWPQQPQNRRISIVTHDSSTIVSQIWWKYGVELNGFPFLIPKAKRSVWVIEKLISSSTSSRLAFPLLSINEPFPSFSCQINWHANVQWNKWHNS